MKAQDPSKPAGQAGPNALATDPAFHPPRDVTGSTLGDFRVERMLGRGGMGEVYLATQVSLNRPVALKLLRPDLVENPTYLNRFEAEAWAAAKLNHPNIVHIYTLGCIEGLRFIAMEYVQGTNLREFLERKGSPELPLALQIMKQAGQAVGAAGEVGLVHRDIKPENVLLTRKGQVKIADFGLCRDKEGQHLNLTQTGVTMGTPMYMSPEQVQGHALDHRSDLYSLGVTFYHMLAGFPPFRAETSLALALKHVRDTAVSLAVHRSDLPPELCNVVMKLMAKNPADRYPSAAEMLKDLARVRDSLNASSVPLPMALADATGATVPFDSKTSAGADHSKAGAHPAVPRAPSRAVQMHLPRVRLNAKTILVAVLISALAGGIGGWMARADDLLGPSAPVPRTAPGLWMARWDQVPARSTATAQYRYAQLEAPMPDLEAAWLAVAGRFPGDADAHYRDDAYTQLVRVLFRSNDAERLLVLAGELDHHERKHAERALVPVARAGAAAIRHDVEGVLDLLDSDKLGVASMNEGMAELCLEIVLHAFRSPGAVDRSALLKLSSQYMKTLKVDFLEPADLINPY